MRSSVNVSSNVYTLTHNSFDSDWTLQRTTALQTANLLSSTMLFSSCAILSNATFGGVVLLFAIGSFKKQAKKQTDKCNGAFYDSFMRFPWNTKKGLNLKEGMVFELFWPEIGHVFTLAWHWVICLQGTYFSRTNIGKFVALLKWKTYQV